MNLLWQDLTYAARQLRKSYGFTLSAVLTLALGIGANLTVFAILYGVLLRPLPFAQPHQLVRLFSAYPNANRGPAYSGTQFLFMRRSGRAFQAMAAYDFLPSNVNLIQGGDAVSLKSLRASADFFRVFQMDPALGRGFGPQDTVPNAGKVAVLSDALWRHRFSADPGILGKPITLGNQLYTVVGIANPKFQLDSAIDVWVPLAPEESAGDRSQIYVVVGRLRPHVTIAQAADDGKRVLLAFKDAYPKLWERYETTLPVDFQESVVGDIRPALELLMAAVALLLAMVTANILSLLLTRSVGRRREMSVRAALGASGWRILRQLLAENALLCLAGGMAGVVLAQFAAPALLRLSPLELPSFTSLSLGAPTLAFAALLTAGCAVLFSAVPAMEARRIRLAESLRVNTGQIVTGRNLAQKALVTSEVAISLVLLTGAALLLTSFWKLLHTPSGFRSEHVLSFKNAFSEDQIATTTISSQHVDDLLGRIEALPGVASAAAVNDLPTQIVPDLPFDVVGRNPDRSDASGDFKYMPVTSKYFSTLSIPVETGRAFTTSDTQGSAPVVIMNRQFADTFFKGQNPIGQRIHIGAVMGPGFEDPIREIVGVVGDVRQAGLDLPAPGIMYLPESQIPNAVTHMNSGLLGTSWVVRLKTPEVDITPQLRQLFLQQVRTPLLSVQPLTAVLSDSLARQRFTMLLLSVFGLISLGLGAAGLYGVLSYTVVRQTREIGVRMAIGAQRGDILWMVLREAGILVLLGLIIGGAGTLAGAHLLESLVFGIAPRSPLTLTAAAVVLLFTALLAAWRPARRAASTDPMEALRAE